MDDTNPTKEDEEFVDAIQEDIRWLGYDWDDRFFYASDYFETMYELARGLIERGLAYVCELTPEQMRENRGDLTHPAVSPTATVRRRKALTFSPGCGPESLRTAA